MAVSSSDISQKSAVPHEALYLIPVIAIAIAVALTWIVVRERQWQMWYVARFNDLQSNQGTVFPIEGDAKYPIGSQPAGYISRIVIWLGIIVSGAWAAVLLGLVAG